MTVFKAPWTPDQIRKLEIRQSNPTMHEYTCGKCDHEVLIPTRGGWICPKCDYTQDWCHKEDTE